MLIDDGATLATYANNGFVDGKITFDVPDPDPIPCSDPKIEVFSDFDLDTGTVGGTERLARFFFAANRESVYLTDLTVTIVGDDDITSFAYDHVPDPQDHIMYCELRDWQGNTYGGIENVRSNNTVVFEDLQDFFIYHGSSEEIEVWCKMSNYPVHNGTADGFTAYVASVDDMVFETLTSDALTVENICTTFGLPNVHLDSKAEVYEMGDLLLSWNGPLAGTMVPGKQDHAVLNLWATSMFEDIEVQEAVVFFTGDYQIVTSATIGYEDANGIWVEKSAALGVASPNTVTFTGLSLVLDEQGTWQDVQVSVDIDPSATTGQSITATFASWGIQAIGQDSGRQITLQHITPSTDVVGYEQTVVADSCAFQTDLADGSYVYMSNAVYTVINSGTPAADMYARGFMEILRFDIGSFYDCSDVLVQSVDLRVVGTDNAGSGWNQSIPVQIYRSDDLSQPIWSGVIANGDIVPVTLNLDIMAQDSVTLMVYADTSGASASTDDAVRSWIMRDTLDWSDGNVDAMNDRNSVVTGNTIVF